jgi:hypothetical protein
MKKKLCLRCTGWSLSCTVVVSVFLTMGGLAPAYDVQLFQAYAALGQGFGGKLSISHTSPAYMAYDSYQTGRGEIYVAQLDSTGAPPTTGGTCVTCSGHVANFGTGDVGNPEFDQYGTNLIFSVQNTTLGCTQHTGIGQGWCVDTYTAYLGGTGGTSMSNIQNVTQFTSSQQGSLHPRFSNSASSPMVVWSEKTADPPTSPPVGTYCYVNPSSCNFGIWEMVWCTGSYPTGSPGAAFTVNTATGCTTWSWSGGSAWYESSGDFTGTWNTTQGGTDTGWVMFCGNPNTGQPWYTPSLWAVQLASPNTLVALTEVGPTPNNTQWDEHIHIDSSGARVSYASTVGNSWTPGGTSDPPLEEWVAQLQLAGAGPPSLAENRRMTYYNTPGHPESKSSLYSPSDNAWLPPALCPSNMAGTCGQVMSLIVEPSGPGQPYGNNLFRLYQEGAALSGHSSLTGHARLTP